MKTQLLNALKVVILLLIPILNFAQAPPLGTAADFVLFSSVGAVTNVGTYKYLTHLTGNVGTNSGSSTNFGNVNGVMHDGDGASLLCASNLLSAYNSLSALATDSTLGPVIGNGTTLKAKTYLMPGATSLNLTLTLDAQGNGNAVFIFKTPSAVAYAFTANPNSKIKLINGAQACNVFWQVSGAVNIGAGAAMKGNIVAHGAITLAAQDTLEGRALTVNGAITVSNGALGFLAYTPIGCGSPVLTGPTAPTFVASGSYAVFATTGAATDCGTSRIIGNVGGNTVPPTGYNPDSITGTIHFNDPSTQAAAADLLLVYNYLLGLPYDIKLLDPAEFGHNLVLTPHTYQMDAAVSFTDTLYLDAQGNADAVFIIKAYGAFASSVGSKIILINGTQAKNVYWFCTGAVNIGSNSVFKGAIIAHDAILMTSGTKLSGRVFSTNGALTTCGITASLPSLISKEPTDQSVCMGGSVSFLVSASGTNLTYQWRKGANNLTNGGNISGVTSPTLAINPVSASDAAVNYNVIVRGTSVANDTSRNATLTANPLPAATAGTDRGICINSSTTIGAAPVTGSTYSWTSMPVGYTSTQANPIVTPLVTTTYTVVETVTATGCTNSHSVVVSVNPLPAAVAGPNRTICVYSSTALGASPVTGSTYSWTSVPAGYTSTMANPTVTPLVPTTYTVVETVTATGCFNSHNVVVTLNPLPAAIAGTDRAICLNTSTTLGAAPVTGSTYSWTSVPIQYTSTQANPTVTPLLTTTYTVVETITATGCTNSHSVVVTVNPLPAATAGANRGICINSSTTLGAAPVTGSTYLWSSNPAGFTSAMANPTVNPLVTTIYTVVETTTATGCVNSNSVTVTVNPIPVPTITGTNNLCANSGYYLYTTETNQTSYIWTISSGGTITYGQGTNQIQVLWNIEGDQFVTVNYASTAGCQAAIPTTYNVTVNGLPGAAGNIIGVTTVCRGATGITYSVGNINYATFYVWSLPAGATIASGNGTNSITVDFAANASSGPITVFGANSCGSGSTSAPLNVTLTSLPDAAGAIDGASNVCLGGTGYVYMIAVIPNATGYFWTLPAGATINGVQNSNSITIDFASNASSGTITVVGTNNCGAGPVSSIDVTTSTKPATPSITANDNLLTSSAATGNQWYHGGNVVTGATAQTYTVPANQPGWYWTVINPLGCSSDESNHLYIAGVGVAEIIGKKFNIYPVPNDGHFTASIANPTDAAFNIYIYNYLGVMIYQKLDIMVSGTVEQTIDISTAPAGVYTVVFKNSENNVIRKILVNK